MGKMNIRIGDERLLAQVRAILTYEALARNRTIGQVVQELVMEAVDLDSCPSELRDYLLETESELRESAVNELLSSVGRTSSCDERGPKTR